MNTLSLDQRAIFAGLLGALGVVAGSTLEKRAICCEGYEHNNHAGHLLLYLGGWGLIVYSIASSHTKQLDLGRGKSILAIISALAIVFAAYTFNKNMSEGKPVPDWVRYLFIAGWLGVAYSASLKSGEINSFCGSKGVFNVIAALFILSGVMYYEKKSEESKEEGDMKECCKRHGAGMIMYGAGFVLLAVGNAVM